MRLIIRPSAPVLFRSLLRTLIAFLCCTNLCLAWTKSGTTYTTDGSLIDVQSAIDAATAGDTVNIPAGTFTWGDGGASLEVVKAITVQGAGSASTTIVISSSAGGTLISVYAPATVRGITITDSNLAGSACFGMSAASNWRISDITYLASSSAGYFAMINGVYGLIDNCHLTGGAGNNELIFMRGPTDSWQTDHSMGGADNVFIEDCTFLNSGYVCDANSNARCVVRHCTITGGIKIDGHGKASNTPARGVRHMEVYDNRFTDGGYYAAIEIRGGTGRAFNNIADAAPGVWFLLVEYGCLNTWPNFNNVLQTPADYPIDDQIGVGKDPKSAGSEPYYLWNNRQTGGQWPLAWKSTGGDFSLEEIIAADRDYFNETASFNGTSGVGSGTRSQMNAIAATKRGVGYWVTDEGEWNANHSGPDGELFTWSGTSWILTYAPFTYPHPLRSASPVTPTNHSPVANALSVSTHAGTPTTIAFSASDADGDALTYSIVANPTHGTLSGSGANCMYAPAAGYSGPDSFTFKANDGQTDSNVAVVSITVSTVTGGSGGAGTGTGLSATYCNNMDFSGRMVFRTDPTVNFAWKRNSPAPGISNGTFSVRWSGQVQAQRSETYTFSVTGDDGVRLWVNGQLLIDQWKDQAAKEYSRSIALVAGQKYALVLAYYQNTGLATAQLRWSSASTAKQIIPTSQLYPASEAGRWTSQDIGAVGLAGSASTSNGVFAVSGSGNDIWNQADAFRFVSQPLSGDGTIVARVASLQDTDPWAKAGVMVRESTAAGARHAFCCVTRGNGVAFQYRAAANGPSSHIAGSPSRAPRWVKLVRQGSTLTGYESADGQTWTVVGSTSIALGNPVQIGLAVSSHDNAESNTAIFDSVAVTPGGSG